MLDHFATAAGEIFTPLVIAYIVLGVLLGYIVGALPGMNRTTAIAVGLPFTFTMSPAAALSFRIGISKGGQTGPAVTAILLNEPGEPSSVVTTYDSYPMARHRPLSTPRFRGMSDCATAIRAIRCRLMV